MAVFDDQAKKYDQWYMTSLGRHVDETETRCALELLRPGPGMKVLDVGCGTGNFSIKLVRLGCDVLGIDISREMLAVAGEKARMEG
ncbi:MAG: methyltransferase domain-containing protein, partial [Synergistales bacterium]|nr:methyltransferase domain-containing protein [Synergistales bacterium]